MNKVAQRKGKEVEYITLDFSRKKLDYREAELIEHHSLSTIVWYNLQKGRRSYVWSPGGNSII